MTAVALVLAAAACLCWPDPSPLRGVTPAATARPAVLRRGVVAALGGAAVVVLLGLPWWTGIVLMGGAVAVVARLRPTRSAAVHRADRALLAESGDLIAACLDGGHAPGRAVAEVIRVTAPRAPEREPGAEDPWSVLAEAAGMVRLGSAADVAWQAAVADPDLRGLAAVARRSDIGGAALAAGIRDWSAALRRQVEEAESAAAGRVGVVLTAPLVCCFLPAFVCLGLAPVVLSLLTSLDIF